jgi:hypothetical protein
MNPGSGVAPASLLVAVRHAAQGVFPMDDFWHLIADQISDRVSGPMKFRIVLQPLMATFLAVRSGLRDAKKNARPYFYDLILSPGRRVELIKEGWKSIARLFFLAMVLDIVYQIFVQHSFHLRAALLVAIVLAILPYLLLRGIVTRIATRLKARP